MPDHIKIWCNSKYTNWLQQRQRIHINPMWFVANDDSFHTSPHAQLRVCVTFQRSILVAKFNNSTSIEAVILEKIVKLSCVTLNILRYDCPYVLFEDTSAGIWWIIFRKMCAVINKLKDSRPQCERIFAITFSQIYMPCDVVGAAPTGDVPTTSEWSTILLLT